MKKIVIIGNGISGITAARHIRKRSDNEILVISSETPEFFSRTALMYVYMGHLRFQDIRPYESYFWKKNRIDLRHDCVESIDASTKRLFLKGGKVVSFDVLIIACGSKYNVPAWPGIDLPGVQGLYSYQDLELLEKNTHPVGTHSRDRKVKHAVLAGGGLIGVELAEMLSTRNIDVTFLVREERFWGSVLPKEEGKLIDAHLHEHGINVKYNTEIASIHPGEEGRVKKIITKNGTSIECELVGVTIGVSPNIAFLENSGIQTDRGIVVDQFLRTNMEDIYAIGDCAQNSDPLPGRKNIEQVWYTGRMMGEIVARTITGELSAYVPGPWFNSAKFFDLEYQTYGTVGSELGEGEAQVYWEHADRKKAVKMVYDKGSRLFKGINCIGIRMRHEKFDQWLRAEKSIDFVLEHLHEANFDPEFFPRFEREIRNLK